MKHPVKHLLIPALLSAMAVAAPAPIAAQDSALQKLDRRDELTGWEAVGRVDVGGGSFCTGVLIAPDLVLTAGHCIVSKSDGSAVDPARIVFRAGYSNGNSVAERRVKHSVVHKDYDIADRDGRRKIRTDVALLKLASPIATTEAAPFRIARHSVGDRVSVVSYARGRSEALSWQRSCSVRDKEPGFASFSCDVTFGSSGAPVFDTSGNRPEIVSIISSGRREGSETISFGPLIPEPIAELKEALRTSQGVNVAGGGVASVVQRSGGARFVKLGTKSGSGARFVRP